MSLLREELDRHPDLLPKCLEPNAEEAVFSFLESQREEFEAEFEAPDGDTRCLDELEKSIFEKMADDLHKNGGSSYYFKRFVEEFWTNL